MPKKNLIQIWLEYAVVRAIFSLLSILPRSVAVFSGICLAKVFYFFLGKQHRIAMKNLEIAFPEKSYEERKKIAKKSFQNLGRILGEISRFPRATPENLAKMVEFQFETEESRNSDDLKFYEAEKAKGRGTIIVCPHLGNWEMAVFSYSALREPLSYLARPLDNPKIEELTVKIRTRFGNQPINKTNSLVSVIDILRTGGILGVLPDVNAHPKEGVFVPFFNVPACTPAGVAMLAIRTNAMIVPICGVWNENKRRYQLIHGKIIEAIKTGNRQNDITETTALYTAELEKFIKAFPDQYLWIHKRWKTRPHGERDFYENL